MGFHFVGRIAASKSLLNRFQILRSYNPDLLIRGESEAEDVLLLKNALSQLSTRSPHELLKLDCGQAGTVLRFLALRVAREKGSFLLQATERLFSRPLNELLRICRQLGSFVELRKEGLYIQSDGWRVMGDVLYIPSERSSQFASAVLLNAWNLPFELFFALSEERVSEPYLRMTWKLVEERGLQIKAWSRREFRILPRQKLKSGVLHAEPDMSSAFALAACATVGGQVRFTDWPQESLQPDFIFVKLLQEMKARVETTEGGLAVQTTAGLKPLSVNLKGAPDLFPVLACLSSFAEGESHFEGLEHLQYKESSRLQNTLSLLERAGISYRWNDRQLILRGMGRNHLFASESWSFDPDQDHRMAMAAAVLKLGGHPIEILHKEVVQKSFPEFFKVIGLEI